MTNTINSSTSPLDAVTCLLMAKIVSRRPNFSMGEMFREVSMGEMFWETLPDRIPNLEAHLPALIFAARNETKRKVMKRVSSHPLPPTLSPKAVGWRAGLIAAWEKRLQDQWMYTYISALTGLAQVDKCGLPPGVTCPSVLPILLKEARRVHAGFMRPGTPSWKVYEQLRCLATLSAWRPGPHVILDPAILNEWKNLWLELYQQENRCVGEKQPNDVIVLKGIAAKALLNLMETDGKEAPELPTGMESLLLESLMRAAEVGGTERPDPDGGYDTYQLSWLSWQPRDVTRFPLDTLAELPKSLLKRFRLSCQSICQNTYNSWCEGTRKEIKKVTNPLLTELIKWDRVGVLAACGVDLLPSVAAALGDYLNKFHGDYALGQEHLLISHEVCRWLTRHEVANVKEGRELLQQLESHWIIKCCNSRRHSNASVSVAWNGRIQLQRAGLATEDPDTFQESLMKAIKHESNEEIQMVLSIWKPGEDAPIMRRRAWRRCWKEKLSSWYLKSGYVGHSISAAVALLKPDATNNLIGQREKLRHTLTLLPKIFRLQLSVADITVLMGELLPRSPNAAADVSPNRGWQFRSNETRFHVPTESDIPASTSANVQPPCTNQMLFLMRTPTGRGNSDQTI